VVEQRSQKGVYHTPGEGGGKVVVVLGKGGRGREEDSSVFFGKREEEGGGEGKNTSYYLRLDRLKGSTQFCWKGGEREKRGIERGEKEGGPFHKEGRKKREGEKARIPPFPGRRGIQLSGEKDVHGLEIREFPIIKGGGRGRIKTSRGGSF